MRFNLRFLAYGVSIHAPVKGATIAWKAGRVSGGMFQSTLP